MLGGNMPYHHESLQEQLDALHDYINVKTKFYERQCVHRMGEHLRLKAQQRQQARLRFEQIVYHMRYWSSRIFIWSGQAMDWLGRGLMEVGYRLAPAIAKKKDETTPPEETVVEGTYQVIEANTEHLHER
jgi:hypothetical protein